MPYEIVLEAPPAGYTMHHSSGIEGTPALVAVREFKSSEDGELFLSRLEGFPSQWIAQIPSSSGVTPSTIDHLLAIIHRDLRVTLYVNECTVHATVLLNRRVEAGEVIYENDVVDIDALNFEGVVFPKDAAILCVFSAGWRKGMFFDFTALEPGAPERDYDVEQLLGSFMAYVRSQRVFHLNEADWTYLIEWQWFPFVTLPKSLKSKIIAFARDRQDLDRLVPELAEAAKELLPRMLERWSESSVFEPHLQLLRHAAQKFDESDFVSCTAILYPRIEGLLRTAHEAIGAKKNATQKALSNTGVTAGGKDHHPFSWLLPDMFRRYLDDAYFANFEPGKPAKLSRNSIGHGVASADEFNQKAAAIGFFILDQLFYFMPTRRAR
jgi:hypothetical protein